MKVTEDVITHVRSLLVDNYVDDEDRFFTDEELSLIIGQADSLNYILYILYSQKAGKVLTEEGRIKAIKAGSEEVQKLSCIEMSKAFLDVAESYKRLWLNENKSISQFIY